MVGRCSLGTWGCQEDKRRTCRPMPVSLVLNTWPGLRTASYLGIWPCLCPMDPARAWACLGRQLFFSLLRPCVWCPFSPACIQDYAGPASDQNQPLPSPHPSSLLTSRCPQLWLGRIHTVTHPHSLTHVGPHPVQSHLPAQACLCQSSLAFQIPMTLEATRFTERSP